MATYDIEIKVTIRVDTGPEWLAEIEAEMLIEALLGITDHSLCETVKDEEACRCIAYDIVQVVGVQEQAVVSVVDQDALVLWEAAQGAQP